MRPISSPWLATAWMAAAVWTVADQARGAQDLVLDINTAAPRVQPSSGPGDLFHLNDLVLFAASDATHGRELWTLDGAGQPALLADLQPGVQSSSPSSFTELPGGLVLFVANAPGTGFEPWVTDGTLSGTSLLADLNPGAASSFPQRFAQLGPHLYFFADNGSLGCELWRTDGTSAGTTLVLDTIPGSDGVGLFELPPLVSNGNQLLYAAFSVPLDTWRVWASNGTAAGTFPLADLTNGRVETPRDWVTLGSQFLFPARDDVNGLELWTSDGTLSGTGPLLDLLPGGDSNPEHLLEAGGLVYFAADSGPQGVELFATDGTAAGTGLVADLADGGPLFNSSNPIPLAEINGELFFLASNPATGTEPWISDGTEAGTRLLADINPLSSSSLDPNGVLDTAWFAGELYFQASSASTGSELWKTDGLSPGTQLVADLEPGPIGSSPSGMLSTGSQVLFAAESSSVGLELFRTDGTEPGTNLLGDLFPGETSEGSAPENLTRVGNRVFFTAEDETAGRELWMTDGTTLGTSRVADLTAGPNGSDPAGLTPLGDRLFFFASSDAAGAEPWITDGTQAGTMLLGDLSPGPIDTFLSGSEGIPYDGRVYFSTITLGGSKLWRTDGTPAGTEIFLESTLAPFGLIVGDAVEFGGELFVRLNYPEDGAGTELYKTSGVPGDLQLVADLNPGASSGVGFPTPLVPAGGFLYFQAQSASSGRELFRSDGTAAGTTLVSDLLPGSASSDPRDLVALGSALLFLAKDASGLLQPFATDGTSGGTVQLASLPGGAQPGGLGVSEATGFFREQLADGSVQLWGTDGTPAGTALLLELSPAGTTSTSGFGFARPATSPQLVFPNNNGASGSELWLTDGSGPGTKLVADINPGGASAFPGEPIRLGGALLLAAEDGLHGRELHSLPLPLLDMWVAEPFGNACGDASLEFEVTGTPSGDQPFEFAIVSSEPGALGFIAITNNRGNLPFGDGCTSSVAGVVLSLLPFVTDTRGESFLEANGSSALAGIPFQSQAFGTNTRGDLFSSPGLELILAP